MSLDQWETFYRSGAIVTGPAGPDGGYDLELRAAWVEFFSTLGPSASVLDIGTARIIGATFSGDAAVATQSGATLASGGAVRGRFFGASAAALAGTVKFDGARQHDTAFGGTKN